MKHITVNDIKQVGAIAQHYDTGKLNIAMNEALIELRGVFGGYIPYIQRSLDSETFDLAKDVSDAETLNTLLLSGGYHTTSTGQIMIIDGLKKAISYVIYSRYVIINNTQDTANGLVRQMNDFSTPTSLKDVKSIAEFYANTGRQMCKDIIEVMKDRHDAFEFVKQSKPHQNNDNLSNRTGSRFTTIHKID
ncbi:hypothetical protein HX088_11315 [Empedobacter sp. 225-1]|uniref:DUF6712 family protein n=1 Tax=Empedobacter sp. 225-1 TaxID=2746725 RepID=UPI0025776814|nr:hypothetical protein [Empedobacter sp. 225-1]MDM1523855.1 hypothetical protein [Empedobacter sp. 225-1]